MNVLVTGAAGYIGSHAVRALLAAGHSAVALDNLSRGHRAAVPKDAPFIQADVRDTDRIRGVLQEHDIECVLHFAAFAYVGESVERPLLYFDNNTGGTLGLLKAVAESDCRRLVFSSTCATYGEPDSMPIREDTPQRPINPYGTSKLLSEHMLRDMARHVPGFGCALLRYFNVAGAATDGSLGEHHDPETHLIPAILMAALGRQPEVTVHGDDYPTPDGTCIRDYVHVDDLVDAHLAVMDCLLPGDARVFNVGMGRGHSVHEILQAARSVVSRPFKVVVGPRRAGDPPVLFADPSKITTEIGWQARRTDIEAIIASAWRWFAAHPHGYDD